MQAVLCTHVYGKAKSLTLWGALFNVFRVWHMHTLGFRDAATLGISVVIISLLTSNVTCRKQKTNKQTNKQNKQKRGNRMFMLDLTWYIKACESLSFKHQIVNGWRFI